MEMSLVLQVFSLENVSPNFQWQSIQQLSTKFTHTKKGQPHGGGRSKARASPVIRSHPLETMIHVNPSNSC